jgi:hypothetical protein
VAEIFLSYTQSDREWAFWIGYELEALGHQPRIHDWEISGGGNIMAWMEARHHAADRVLCIISNEYLGKPYSSLERQGAQWASLTKRENFLLPVFVERCDPPTLLAPLKRCDLYGITEDDARARLKDFLEPAVKRPPRTFPGAVQGAAQVAAGAPPPPFPGTALSNITLRVPLHFLGRDDALAAVEAALKLRQGRVAITALHGCAGSGNQRLPPPLQSVIAAIIGQLGGLERRPS